MGYIKNSYLDALIFMITCLSRQTKEINVIGSKAKYTQYVINY